MMGCFWLSHDNEQLPYVLLILVFLPAVDCDSHGFLAASDSLATAEAPMRLEDVLVIAKEDASVKFNFRQVRCHQLVSDQELQVLKAQGRQPSKGVYRIPIKKI